MYVCMHAWMHVCMYVCMYACMHACMYVYMIVEWNPTQQLFNTAQHKITRAPLLCCRATVAASRAAWPSRFHRVKISNQTAMY